LSLLLKNNPQVPFAVSLFRIKVGSRVETEEGPGVARTVLDRVVLVELDADRGFVQEFALSRVTQAVSPLDLRVIGAGNVDKVVMARLEYTYADETQAAVQLYAALKFAETKKGEDDSGMDKEIELLTMLRKTGEPGFQLLAGSLVHMMDGKKYSFLLSALYRCNVRAALVQAGPFPQLVMLKIAAQVGSALLFLAELGIVCLSVCLDLQWLALTYLQKHLRLTRTSSPRTCSSAPKATS
jgi:hypothetical protein